MSPSDLPHSERTALMTTRQGEAQAKPGKASRFIRHLKVYLRKHPALAAVLYGRVSSGPQESSGNLLSQMWRLRRKCRKLGIQIVSEFEETCSGWVLDGERDQLIAAVKCAKEHEAKTGVHTVVLAVSVDRFLRSKSFNSQVRPNARPTDAEFRKLRELTGGVPLLTLLRPNMPPGRGRRHRERCR